MSLLFDTVGVVGWVIGLIGDSPLSAGEWGKMGTVPMGDSPRPGANRLFNYGWLIVSDGSMIQT